MNDFENTKRIAGMMGGGWQNVPELQRLVSVVLEANRQLGQDTDELYLSMNRHTCPVRHTLRYLPVAVEEMDGESIVRLPDNVFKAEWVADGLAVTTFRLPVTSRVTVVPKGFETLWLHNAEVDEENLYRQFGYALGLKLPSSHSYRHILNAVFDTLVDGPSMFSVNRFLNAMMGLPVINNPVETVVEISADAVRTDKEVYAIRESDVPAVSVGDTLKEGTPLLNLVEWNAELPALHLGKAFTGMCRAVSFVNEEKAVTLSTEEGFTRVDIAGMDKEFLDITHERGIRMAEEITDPCELSRIRRKIGQTQTEPEPADTASAGLGTFMRFHRFD